MMPLTMPLGSAEGWHWLRCIPPCRLQVLKTLKHQEILHRLQQGVRCHIPLRIELAKFPQFTTNHKTLNFFNAYAHISRRQAGWWKSFPLPTMNCVLKWQGTFSSQYPIPLLYGIHINIRQSRHWICHVVSFWPQQLIQRFKIHHYWPPKDKNQVSH